MFWIFKCSCYLQISPQKQIERNGQGTVLSWLEQSSWPFCLIQVKWTQRPRICSKHTGTWWRRRRLKDASLVFILLLALSYSSAKNDVTATRYVHVKRLLHLCIAHTTHRGLSSWREWQENVIAVVLLNSLPSGEYGSWRIFRFPFKATIKWLLVFAFFW